MAAKKCYDDQWIVITGGSGFIGSCVVRQLNDLGYDNNIIVLDDVTKNDRWKNLCGKKFSEIVSYQDASHWFEHNKNDVEAILHLGSASCPDCLYDLNYRLATELASFAIDYDVRFIYASSAETYGYGRNGFDDQHELLDSLRPQKPVGGMKHLFDLWALRNQCLKKIVGLKFADVYGPNEYHKDGRASLIYRAYKQALTDNKIELPSFGKEEFCLASSRDFVYVKDVARIVCEFLFNDSTGIYNVGSGISTSISEMAEQVKMAMNSTAELIYQDVEDKIEGRQPYALKMDKLKEIISPPSTKLEVGIKDYVQNYLIPDYRW